MQHAAPLWTGTLRKFFLTSCSYAFQGPTVWPVPLVKTPRPPVVPVVPEQLLRLPSEDDYVTQGWPLEPYNYGQDLLPYQTVAVDFLNQGSSWPSVIHDVNMHWPQMAPIAEPSINSHDVLFDHMLSEQDFSQMPASMMPIGHHAVTPMPSTTNTAASMEPPTADEHVAEPALTCPRGCTGSFRRPGDYRRHMRKHEKPRYKCPKFDCDKTFYRADKMRDHVKQGHKGLVL